MKKEKCKEFCYLIRENETNNKIEYFDFNLMKFTNSCKNTVPFSTIDAMTTLFDDEKEFEFYFNEQGEDNKFYNYKIMFKFGINGDFKYCKVIWNDFKLNALSKITDNKVDFSLPIVYSVFDEIISEIKKNGSAFAFALSCAKSSEKKLSDYCEKLIGALACNPKSLSTEMLVDAFRDYRDMRALYLNYKGYQKRDESYKLQLKKLFSN